MLSMIIAFGIIVGAVGYMTKTNMADLVQASIGAFMTTLLYEIYVLLLGFETISSLFGVRWLGQMFTSNIFLSILGIFVLAILVMLGFVLVTLVTFGSMKLIKP